MTYEVSSIGDKRFSALYAIMPDGRTLEMWYQCDIKGYDLGGTNWKLGKGKPPLHKINNETLFELYLNLWRIWSLNNIDLIEELGALAKNKKLTDRFAKTKINQANALSIILNEWVYFNRNTIQNTLNI